MDFEFPGLVFVLSFLVGIVFWGFLLWMAWVLVRSVQGIHAELRRIREHLATTPAARER